MMRATRNYKIYAHICGTINAVVSTFLVYGIVASRNFEYRACLPDVGTQLKIAATPNTTNANRPPLQIEGKILLYVPLANYVLKMNFIV